MDQSERDRFDALFEEALETLPEGLHALLEECPVVLLDRPDETMLHGLGINPASEDGQRAAEEICGLHTGIADTERSVEHSGEVPSVIHLFREGIIAFAGGWEPREPAEAELGGQDAVYEEILVTLLHEIGHQFGLDEEDLERLGYA